MGFLIDSTLLIHAERYRLTPARLIAQFLERWGDEELAISAMSAGELLHGCWRADSPARRARREEFVEAVLGALPVVAVTLPFPSCASSPKSMHASVPPGASSRPQIY